MLYYIRKRGYMSDIIDFNKWKEDNINLII